MTDKELVTKILTHFSVDAMQEIAPSADNYKRKRSDFSCCFCSEEFSHAVTLHDHINESHKEAASKSKRFFLCTDCNGIFAIKQKKRHVGSKAHQGE